MGCCVDPNRQELVEESKGCLLSEVVWRGDALGVSIKAKALLKY
jgi:hypothetical protein